jgi:hypothetical protein
MRAQEAAMKWNIFILAHGVTLRFKKIAGIKYKIEPKLCATAVK